MNRTRTPNLPEIRTATPADLRYVLDLAKRHTNEIGFLPRQAYQNLIAMRRVHLALENDEPAGMILGRDALRWCIAMRPITQAAIQYDAQRRHHGLALVTQAAADASAAGQVALQACCREGLEANKFWRIAGFVEICRLDPTNARNRKVICWRKPLIAGFVPAWFRVPPPVSGHRARKSRT